MIQGITPGPQLIEEHPDIFWGLIASFWDGNVVLLTLNIPLIGMWVRLLAVPYRYLYLMTPQPLMPDTVEAVIALWRRQQKPVILILDGSRFAENIRQRLLQAGMPFLTRIDDAIRVLGLMKTERDFDAEAAADGSRPRPGCFAEGRHQVS